QSTGAQCLHELVTDLVRDLLEEVTLVAKRPDVELEGLQLDALLLGHVLEHDRPEVGLAGDRAERRVLRALVMDHVVAPRRRVGEGLQRSTRLRRHRSYPATAGATIGGAGAPAGVASNLSRTPNCQRSRIRLITTCTAIDTTDRYQIQSSLKSGCFDRMT